MVWPPILMECSVAEDSSFGGGGVGSAGFSFSTGLISFSCSWARAAHGVQLSSAAAATAPRTLTRKKFGIVSAPKANLGKRRWRVYTPREREVKAARITDCVSH